jgi:ABC-type branched-subunit amino acid transport system ATPase component/ABC-type branched-subunit amino acid transport system permease subunit
VTVVAFDMSGPFVALGAISGMVYGLLAVGLVLMYRSSRIVNFAYGEMGAFAAACMALAVVEWGLPYWIAFVGAMGVGALVAVGTEKIVVDRLRNAPAVVGVIATLGLAEVLRLLGSVVNGQIGNAEFFPRPPDVPTFSIGALRVTEAYSTILIVTPFLVVGLAVFLRRGRLGRAMRAASAEPAAAQMAGILPGRMAALAWAIGGALSAYTAILVFPTLGLSGTQAFGPNILLRALAAAVVARMVNLPVALGAGVALGVIEQLVYYNYPSANIVDACLFVVILLALLLQRPHRGRGEDKGAWAAVQAMPPLPEAYQRVRLIRHLGRIVFVVGFGIAVGVSFLSTNATVTILTTIAATAIVGLSVSIITGLGGELSLGQFAIAGTGAIGAFVASQHTDFFLLSLLCAGLVGAAVSLALGIPGLRIRGLFLAVTTLGFALAAQAWLFDQTWAFGSGVLTNQPMLSGSGIDWTKQYYYFSLVALAAALWLARNVWHGGVGLRLRAVRDNEDAARAFSVPATRVKLQGFTIAGFLAGFGGGVYAYALTNLSSLTFPVEASINVAATAVVGGLGVLWGPIVGALYIFGIPRFVPLDTAGLAATALGWLLIVLFNPGGIAQAIQPLRDRIADSLARRAGIDPESERAGAPAGSVSTATIALPGRRGESITTGETVLAVQGVSKRYGGVMALESVDLRVAAGETVGLIGPNGAGKTTLFEIISGFTKPDAGTVEFLGSDVSRLSPEARASRGLVRSFQDAALFPTFSVLEVVTLALERTTPTRSVRSLFAADRVRAKRARADEIVGLMGLNEYRDTQILALSTGTRRITEFACLVALEPTVLLLDEPSSGIAQRESEALGQVLRRIKDELDLTLVIVEHDMPLVMGISDRIVAMAAGQVLCVGTPEEIRTDERVIESYLGGNLVAIERSGSGVSV